MEVYISIDGVLRNLIQKFEYHYNNNFLESEAEVDEGVTPFDYRIHYPLRNDDLLSCFNFQSEEEFNNFLFVDYPLEIFGHSTLSYPAAMMDLNKLIYENSDINFTIVGLDEFGKARAATLFFLSKYGYLGNNIKFIKSNDISKEWNKCNIWITDNYEIIKRCPQGKTAVKFITEFNQYFDHNNRINNLTKIELSCLKSSELPILSMLTRLLKHVAQFIHRKK